MRVSIVIPSLNQAQFIEETLDSIFSQNHPDLEVLVFDGGSTDGSVDILRRWSGKLAYWESRPDRGQSHAINKGILRMTGEAWAYLNSDDLLMPESLATIAEIFSRPEVVWISGLCENFDSTGVIGGIVPGQTTRQKDYLSPWKRPHQFVFPFSGACFMRRCVPERIGLFDESFHFSMDIEYYCRAIFEGRFEQVLIDATLARWRWHQNSKTMSQGIAYGFRRDETRIAERYTRYLPSTEQSQLIDELKEQGKWLPAREAMWFLGEGRRLKALATLHNAAWKNPSCLSSRGWWGAVRRCVLQTSRAGLAAEE